MRKWFKWMWASWLLLFVAVEAWAIARAGRGDTLSEHVWRYLRPSIAGKAAVGGLLGWLVYHFLIYTGGSYGALDALSIALGVLVGLIGPRFKRNEA